MSIRLKQPILIILLCMVFAGPVLFGAEANSSENHESPQRQAVRFETRTVLESPDSEQEYRFHTAVTIFNGGFRIERHNQIVIANLTEGKIYQIDTEQHSYRITDAAKFLGEITRERGGSYLERFPVEFSLQQSGATRRIGEFDCREIVFESMGGRSRYWITESVPGIDLIRETLDRTEALFGAGAMLGSLIPHAAEWSIPGLVIEMETEIGDILLRSVTENFRIIEIEGDPLKLDPQWQLSKR